MVRYCISVILSLSFFLCNGQQLELGVGLGMSGYSGELASYRFSERFKVLLNPALKLELSYPISHKFSASIAIWSGTIEGADSISVSGTRLRNLDFHSPLTEGSFNILYFPFRRDYDQKFNLYMSAGIGVFHFNPKTNYNGLEVDLQPLGTEGQGLSQFPERVRYNLTQLSIPVGGGLQYRISESIKIQASVMGAYTRTDYLDDVSSTYVDRDLLQNANGSLSAALSNRYLPNADGSISGLPGSARGSAGVNDYYFSGFVSILYSLGGRGSGCYNW